MGVESSNNRMNTQNQAVAVIGGGVNGLSTAWQLSRSGHRVTVFERDQFGQAASFAGAGMLAPQAEAKFEEEALMKLGQLSLSWYPRFLSELAADDAAVPAFNQCGTMLIGISRDDTAQLKRLFQFRENLNLKVKWLTGSEARNQVPELSPRVTAGMWLPDDAEIDNHQLIKALVSALKARNQTLFEGCPAHSIQKDQSGHWAVYADNELPTWFDKVVIASGAWSNAFQIESEKGLNMGLRPVKGELVALTQTPALTLRTMVRTPRAYMVPKADGSLLIGATSYEKGYEHWPSAGGVKDLLQFGYEALPASYELPLKDVRVGLRPAAQDNSPVIGETEPGLYWATGHYRHGFLLAPLTAYTIQSLVNGDKPEPLTTKFTPDRFTETAEKPTD